MSELTYAQLSNGQKIPRVGLGTWQAKDELELELALSTAIDVGYRHIDTATVYDNEELIGKVLKKLFDSGKIKREELFITTKLPLYSVKAEKVEKELTDSLKKLGLDYVDLYLIHFPICLKKEEGEAFKREQKVFETEVTNHLAVWKKMEDQVIAGRAKAIGVSNFNEKQIEKILKSNPRIKPANLQIENHICLQQNGLVNYALENGLTVTAFSPLGCPSRNEWLASIGKETKNLPDMLNNFTIKKIADKHGRTNAQVMLRFLLQRNIIVIPKSVKEQRLKENFDLFSFVLDDNDMKALRALDIGEDARVCDFKLFPGLEKNAEWPF